MEENYPHHDEYSSLNIIVNFDKLYNNVSCRIKLLAWHGNKFKLTENHAERPSAAAVVIAASVVIAAAAIIFAMGTSLDTRIMAEFGKKWPNSVNNGRS